MVLSHPLAAEAEIVFVESKSALTAAQLLGLNPTAEIRSSAPALIVDPEIRVVQIDATLTPDRLIALDDAAIDFSHVCRDLFPEDADIALIAARVPLLQLQPIIMKAACLEDEDFERPVAVVRLTSRDPMLNDELSAPLAALLTDNPALSVIDVDVATLEGVDDPRPPTPSFWQRLAFAHPGTLIYRLVERLVTRGDIAGPRGTILMLRENELSKETALWMLPRGFLFRHLGMSRRETMVPEAAELRLLEGIVSDTVDRLFRRLIADRPRAAVTRCFVHILAEQFGRYRASLEDWRNTLDGMRRLRPRAVFTNHLNDPEFVGLHKILRERRIPLVGFQHGVTVEINGRIRRYDAQLDSAVADIEMMFNDEGVAVSEASAFRRARSVAVGLPSDYRRGRRLKGLRAAPPIWYLSTALYLANDGALVEGVNDNDKAAFETELIERVLSRAGHEVLYKPYPGRRYLDPDPVLATAEAAENIEVHRDRIDLRYIVGGAKVLISSRSYSTPSWCLAADKPLIHIDIPEQAPLTPEARESFEAGLFLFDAGAPEFHESLLAFIARPLDEIEADWRAKAPARRELMRRFMSAHPNSAGRRAAGVIAAWIEAPS